MRWTARLYLAAAAADLEAFNALVAALPDDPDIVAEHLHWLLTSAVNTLACVPPPSSE